MQMAKPRTSLSKIWWSRPGSGAASRTDFSFNLNRFAMPNASFLHPT